MHLVRELRTLSARLIPQLDDRATGELALRFLGSTLRLYEEHAPDSRGRCAVCGRFRRCPVLASARTFLPPDPGRCV